MISWVDVKGGLDHLPILPQLKGMDPKPAAHFKFNDMWLGNLEFQQLVCNEWCGFDLKIREIASFQMAKPLQKLKGKVVAWITTKKEALESGLKATESQISKIYDLNPVGFWGDEIKSKLKDL